MGLGFRRTRIAIKRYGSRLKCGFFHNGVKGLRILWVKTLKATNKEPQGKTHGFESGVYRLVFFASLRDLFRPPRSGTQPPYTRSEFGVCIGA